MCRNEIEGNTVITTNKIQENISFQQNLMSKISTGYKGFLVEPLIYAVLFNIDRK